MEKLLDVKQAAEILNIKVSTLYRWVHTKQINYVKIGGKLTFKPSVLETFISSNSY